MAMDIWIYQLFVIPYSHFGFYNENVTVIDMKERDIYTKDLIGLKTLDKAGKLVLITVPGIDHFMWHKNLTIVDKYILPYLD
ncbi:palmitoyl-protein thioesterase/dolichyldiphosphatase 1 [Holotrichia oblita]|uniref:Palmitoyl-protein thioesterase/dolichyldiphosphatase 1 n=1 Tax=Holotrichia oblita TaxID=644536 RepID=A0ACB9TGL8_HOLOL|nr:palmitoyl-protein thioesterase/dolichyldiphosphatase 1 [Holotrichia oblita]